MIDLKKIQSDFESILVYSQDYPFYLNAENLINQWFEAKSFIINRFNGQLIVRSKTPVKIYLSEQQRKDRFNDFLNTLEEGGILTEEFESFLRDNERGFFDNTVLLPYPSFNISLGSKLSKSFKRFLTNSETIRWAQDTASRYIQENKIEGYLYLSVHPLDFLTLSENNEEWWSCQTLDGDYRAGNLSYMVDETTIVAYLSSGKEEHLKCLPSSLRWNSKKWRMLIHTDWHNNIYYSRQYPYESKELLKEIHKMIHQYIHFATTAPIDYGFKTVQTQWASTMIPCNQIFAGGRVHDTRDIVDVSNYIGYSDIIHSNSYTPVIAVNLAKMTSYTFGKDNSKEEEERLFNDTFGIKIGENPICPCCGGEIIKRQDSFLCESCIAENDADEDFYLRCDGCYHRIYDEDEVFWMNDKPYCKKCYNEMQKEDSLTLEEEEDNG